MTKEQLNSLIVDRIARLGLKIHPFVVDGVDSCCEEYRDLLCKVWKLYGIQQIINNPELLKEAELLHPNIFEIWTNVVQTIAGYSDDDFLVVDSTFLSFFNYYNNPNSSNNGSGGNGNAIFTPINGVGRNFTTPSKFDQVHVYNTLMEYINAHLFPAQPPALTVSGELKLNSDDSWIPFQLVERGDIVREVKLIVSANKGANGGDLVETTTTLPNSDPASPTVYSNAQSLTTEYVAFINSPTITTWGVADKNDKTFAQTVKDSLGKVTTANIGYQFADQIFYGSAVIPEVDLAEDFIKTLGQRLDTDQYGTYAVSIPEGEHFWFAHRADLPGATVFTDLAVNIAGGVQRVEGDTILANGSTVFMTGSTILVTFSNGYSAAYKIFVSDNSGLGSVNFKIASS